MDQVVCLTLKRNEFNRLLKNLKLKLLEYQAIRTANNVSVAGSSANALKQMSSLSHKRRISGFNTHGQRDDDRIPSIFKRLGTFLTQSLWSSIYARMYREMLLDASKCTEYGKFANMIMKANDTRYEAVTAICAQATRILEMDPSRRGASEHAFILGLMKQRNHLKDKLCRNWPAHQYAILAKKIKILSFKAMRKIVEADTRGTTAFLILRGAVRVFAKVSTAGDNNIDNNNNNNAAGGPLRSRTYYEEDLFPGEIFCDNALSGVHNRLITAMSISDVDLAVIDDQDFMTAQDRDTMHITMEEKAKYLAQVPMLRHWDSYKLLRLAHVLIQEEIEKNIEVITHQTVSKDLFFIVHGKVELYDSRRKKNVITTLSTFDYYGESGFCNRFVKALNSKVTEEFYAVSITKLEVLVFQEQHFALFDISAIDIIRSSFLSKLQWRRERVKMMKKERAHIRKHYHIMKLQAEFLPQLRKQEKKLKAKEDKLERKKWLGDENEEDDLEGSSGSSAVSSSEDDMAYISDEEENGGQKRGEYVVFIPHHSHHHSHKHHHNHHHHNHHHHNSHHPSQESAHDHDNDQHHNMRPMSAPPISTSAVPREVQGPLVDGSRANDDLFDQLHSPNKANRPSTAHNITATNTPINHHAMHSVSKVDLAYQQALVHPLDTRLHQSSHVWVPAKPAHKMLQNIEQIPHLMHANLDMLMLSSTCRNNKNQRQYEQLLDKFHDIVKFKVTKKHQKNFFKEQQKHQNNNQTVNFALLPNQQSSPFQQIDNNNNNNNVHFYNNNQVQDGNFILSLVEQEEQEDDQQHQYDHELALQLDLFEDDVEEEEEEETKHYQHPQDHHPHTNPISATTIAGATSPPPLLKQLQRQSSIIPLLQQQQSQLPPQQILPPKKLSEIVATHSLVGDLRFIHDPDDYDRNQVAIKYALDLNQLMIAQHVDPSQLQQEHQQHLMTKNKPSNRSNHNNHHKVVEIEEAMQAHEGNAQVSKQLQQELKSLKKQQLEERFLGKFHHLFSDLVAAPKTPDCLLNRKPLDSPILAETQREQRRMTTMHHPPQSIMDEASIVPMQIQSYNRQTYYGRLPTPTINSSNNNRPTNNYQQQQREQQQRPHTAHVSYLTNRSSTHRNTISSPLMHPTAAADTSAAAIIPPHIKLDETVADHTANHYQPSSDVDLDVSQLSETAAPLSEQEARASSSSPIHPSRLVRPASASAAAIGSPTQHQQHQRMTGILKSPTAKHLRALVQAARTNNNNNNNQQEPHSMQNHSITPTKQTQNLGLQVRKLSQQTIRNNNNGPTHRTAVVGNNNNYNNNNSDGQTDNKQQQSGGKSIRILHANPVQTQQSELQLQLHRHTIDVPGIGLGRDSGSRPDSHFGMDNLSHPATHDDNSNNGRHLTVGRSLDNNNNNNHLLTNYNQTQSNNNMNYNSSSSKHQVNNNNAGIKMPRVMSGRLVQGRSRR
jgi:CRP-like cAMP-binding protein